VSWFGLAKWGNYDVASTQKRHCEHREAIHAPWPRGLPRRKRLAMTKSGVAASQCQRMLVLRAPWAMAGSHSFRIASGWSAAENSLATISLVLWGL